MIRLVLLFVLFVNGAQVSSAGKVLPSFDFELAREFYTLETVDEAECLTCPAFTDYGKLLDDVKSTPWFKQAILNSASKAERNSFFNAWDVLTKSGSSFAGEAFAASEDVVKTLASDLRRSEELRGFLSTAPNPEVSFDLFKNRVRAWETVHDIAKIDQLDISTLEAIADFTRVNRTKLHEWELDEEKIKLLFDYYYRFDDSFNQSVVDLLGDHNRGLNWIFQKIDLIEKRTGGNRQSSFFSSVIQGFKHSNANNRKGWKWLVEYVGKPDNHLSQVIDVAGNNSLSNSVRFNKNTVNLETGKVRLTDVHVSFLDGEEIQHKMSLELKSQQRVTTQTQIRFTEEFVTDFVEFETLLFFWVYKVEALETSITSARQQLLIKLKHPETISLLNRCKNGNVQAYRNKLEDIFSLNPGEDISVSHMADFLEEVDADGLSNFNRLFSFH
jgi:hypothetical protein